MPSANQNQVNFVACLTSLFKDIVLAVDENDEILRSLCEEDAIVYAICELQEECDSRGSLVLKKYLDNRKLVKLTAEVKCYKSNLLSVGVEGPDPMEIELYMEEILSLTQLGEDYMEHMVSKIRGLSSVDELGLRAMKAFRSGNFSKVAQEISGRSVSTSNINSVIAVLGSAVSLLGSEYIDALQHKVFVAPADVERVNSCLSELGEMSNSFKKALNVGMEQLVATVTGRIRPRLLHSADSNVAWLQPLMTANNYNSFVHFVIDLIVKRLEVMMIQKRFLQLGGLQLDRDTRALVSHFSSMTQRTVRDKFTRLTQMATILNLEKVSEILDFWGEKTWRLTPAEVRRILGLRVDFKPEPIAALKL
ncbi:hypothetical protein RHMOL_Rhmol07G0009500 [Rhododendron molle]|uniref:Uncharacterized protein n=1 Tax=Rhododendron molle TaxID=49168 RepID=A0ACC0MVT2_RHOML|nr:hypothetical protein RHMOL_Rhmol07G0009500 [Rhododendron molle]